MSADFWAVVGFLGFVVAASLLAFGVWKLDVRLVAAGAVAACSVWLGFAFTNAAAKWAWAEFVTLRLRPVDDLGGEMIAGAVVEAIETSDARSSKTCRLPVRFEAAGTEPASFLA